MDVNNKKVKDMINEAVQKTVKDAYVKEMRKEIYRFMNSVGKEIIIEELKKVDIPEVVLDRMNDMVKENFRPIIKEATDIALRKVTNTINCQLKKVINLKTSTISDINNAVQDLPCQTEEESLKQLQIDFPEYYEQIENKTGV